MKNNKNNNNNRPKQKLNNLYRYWSKPVGYQSVNVYFVRLLSLNVTKV